MSERLLHVALRTPFERQPALAAALKSIAPGGYGEIDWQVEKAAGRLLTALKAKTESLRPTVVFMQLQCPDVVTPSIGQVLRGLADPSCVFISWDGDIREDPGHPKREWFSDLGKELDISLITNTTQLEGYRALGGRYDYLQIGVDTDIYKPSPPTPGTPEIVLLASRYDTHDRRNKLAEALYGRYGDRFAVYGHGWGGRPFGRPMLKQTEEAGVYSAARCAISMSIRNDLAHYSSDRLFRALCSGGMALVEHFPQIQDLLPSASMTSWLIWDGQENLFGLVKSVLEHPFSEDERQAGAEMSRKMHSWQARMPELLRYVNEARKNR